jgi:acetate kinase
MRTLAAAADSGNHRARLAIEVFCYRLAKAVCGLMAGLETLDAFVFTGGIGENSALVRSLTADHFRIHGVVLEDAANADHGCTTGGRVSAPTSRIPCLVVPTNEELMIARETLRLVS